MPCSKPPNRCSAAAIIPIDDHVSPDGRVMEVLSEHCCEGWLEGYVLTGRHGVFPTYEAFAQVVDSMLTQHAKWLKECQRAGLAAADPFDQLPAHQPRLAQRPQRLQPPGARLHRQRAGEEEHDRADLFSARRQLPAVSVADHCLRSRNYVNLVVCGKQPQLQWLSMDEARKHCSRGAAKWDFASNDGEQRARRRAGLLRRRAHDRGRGHQPGCCKSTCPTSACG